MNPDLRIRNLLLCPSSCFSLNASSLINVSAGFFTSSTSLSLSLSTRLVYWDESVFHYLLRRRRRPSSNILKGWCLSLQCVEPKEKPTQCRERRADRGRPRRRDVIYAFFSRSEKRGRELFMLENKMKETRHGEVTLWSP